MKKNIFTIGALSLSLFLGSCGMNLSRQMDYDYDRAVENKSPSGGGKVQYSDAESGYVREQEEDAVTPTDKLERGTNLSGSDVKQPPAGVQRDR